MLFALHLFPGYTHTSVIWDPGETFENTSHVNFDAVCGQELDLKPYLACRELVHVPGSLQNKQRCRGLAPTHQLKAGRTTLQFYMLVPRTAASRSPACRHDSQATLHEQTQALLQERYHQDPEKTEPAFE